MRIDVVTIFPGYLAPLDEALVGRARRAGLLDVRVHDLRRWATGVHQAVDDAPYGGGPGMLMTAPVWGAALDEVATSGDGVPRLLVPTPAGRAPDPAPRRGVGRRAVARHRLRSLRGDRRPRARRRRPADARRGGLAGRLRARRRGGRGAGRRRGRVPAGARRARQPGVGGARQLLADGAPRGPRLHPPRELARPRRSRRSCAAATTARWPGGAATARSSARRRRVPTCSTRCWPATEPRRSTRGTARCCGLRVRPGPTARDAAAWQTGEVAADGARPDRGSVSRRPPAREPIHLGCTDTRPAGSGAGL